MKTRNKVMLLGSVGRDPEIRSIAGGTIVATWSLATNSRYKDDQGAWKEATEWHNLKAFGRLAEVVRDYVRKGSPIDIEGRLKTEQWEKDAQKHYKTVIYVDELILIGGKKDESRPLEDKSGPLTAKDVGFASEEDIPF